MGGRSEVLEMSFIEALEVMLLIKDKEENEYNDKKLHQLIDFQSMEIAAQMVMGGSKDLQKRREDHVKRLSEMAGSDRNTQADKRAEEYQWPPEVQEAMRKKQMENQ